MPCASKIAERNLHNIPDFHVAENLPSNLVGLKIHGDDKLLGYYLNDPESLEDVIVFTETGWYFPAQTNSFNKYREISDFRFRDGFKKAVPTDRILDITMTGGEHVELLVKRSVQDLIYIHDFLRRCSVFAHKW